MTTYTREQFIKTILERLGVQDPNEDIEAEDFATVNEGVQQKFEELYRKGKIPFDIGTEDAPAVIPGRYYLALVGVCAVQFIDTFSAYDRTATLASAQQAGNQVLNEFAEEAQLGSPTRAEYF